MMIFKRLAALSLALCLLAPLGAADAADQATVEPDKGVHQVLGKLYALSALAGLGEKDLAAALPDARTAQVKGVLWVGVPVDRFSTARHFLRAHAPELGIMDGPGGQPWMGGDSAWLRAAASTKGAEGVPLEAAMGSGTDAKELFLGAGGYWWLAPELKSSDRQAILKRWGVTPAPELHAPAGTDREKITASPVGLPEKMHVGSHEDPMSIGMGDVIFSPIPRTHSGN